MKTLVKFLIGLGLLCLIPAMSYALPATPTGLSVDAMQPDGSAEMHWTADPLAIRWYFYLNGTQTYVADKLQCGTDSAGKRVYVLFNLPKTAPTVIISMATTYSGTLSAQSAGVTLTTGTSPSGYQIVRTDASFPLNISGTTTINTGASGLTVTASAYTANGRQAAPGTITAASGSWTEVNLSATAGAGLLYDITFQNRGNGAGTELLRFEFGPSGTAPGATDVGFTYLPTDKAITWGHFPSGWSAYFQGDSVTCQVKSDVQKY